MVGLIPDTSGLLAAELEVEKDLGVPQALVEQGEVVMHLQDHQEQLQAMVFKAPVVEEVEDLTMPQVQSLEEELVVPVSSSSLTHHK